MKKKYWVHYYKDFSNTYDLYWTDSKEMEEALPEGAERITRKRAFDLARRNSFYEQYNSAFAMGTSYIYPASGPFGSTLDSGRIWVG